MSFVRLLGPVDVVDDTGRVTAPGSPIRRSLLALLALDAGRLVDGERLLDQVWDGQAPASGLRALRFHVSKLRSELGVEHLIVTVGAGYRLDAEVDVARAETALGSDQTSLDEWEGLLELWRGDPLADVRACSVLEHEQQRLSELRLGVLERGFRGRVQAGRGSEVIGELTRLCLDHPLREGLWGVLIEAHWSVGHQAEALWTFDRLRLNLVETLGVEPGPGLQELHLRLLTETGPSDEPVGSGQDARLVPSGTATFLFTDVEGSTRLWADHPDEMDEALDQHDRILRDTIAVHGGYVFSTAGDSFAACFARGVSGVRAAVEAQQQLAGAGWPEAAPIRVRMGLHTGEAQERNGDYFGTAVNRAARLMSAAHGSQIVISGATRDVLADRPMKGVELVDLGEHRLKDLSGVERLFQVSADGLAEHFAALRTVDAVPGNLPVQATSFVGRAVEMRALRDLVGAHRLVTLTGVGGVGKTRLAVQVAADLSAEFSDGVWLVELAPVGDPAAVPDAVASALGVTARPGHRMSDRIAEALSGRRLLVVLDNCEHVLDAAADMVETILARAATVKIIATSREGLWVGPEHLCPVRPLDVRAGANSTAVELFVERAQEVNPGFELREAAVTTAVTGICQRLDGIALAIELAAARMVSMNPGEVLERLTERFRLLAGPRRGMERHQTLRHAVAWSYDLLDADERRLLNSCAVFADGFGLVATTQICGDDFDEYVVLDLLDGWSASHWSPSSRLLVIPVTGCWRPSASSPKINWPKPAPSASCGNATPSSSPTRPSATGRPGTGPTNASLWTGWMPSSLTCGPRSVGPPTNAT